MCLESVLRLSHYSLPYLDVTTAEAARCLMTALAGLLPAYS